MADAESSFGRPASMCGSISRKERLENMRRREELKDELVNKFRDRYRSSTKGDEASLASTAICKEVNRFVGSSAAVTEANLKRLEQRMQRRAEGRPDFDAASQCSVSAYTVGSVAPGFAPSVASRGPGRTGSLTSRRTRNGTPYVTSTNGSLSARGRSVAAAAADASISGQGTAGVTSVEWSVLDKLAAHMQQEDASRQVKTQRELKVRLKADLEKQMADTYLKQERERERDRQYHAMQVEANKLFQERSEAAEAARQEQRDALKEDRRGQVETIRAQREEEKLREMKEAEEMAKSIQFGMEVERREAEKRQQVRLGQVKEALQVGSESSKMRAEVQRQEAEREDMSVQEYHRMRAMRDRALKDVHAKELAQRDVLASAAAEKALARKREEEAAASKADAELTAKEERDAEQERAKKDRLASQRQQTQAFQLEQMREKQGKRAALSEQKRQQRESSDMAAQSFEDMERRREDARRCWNAEHRVELERQIAAKTASGPSKDVMSTSELQLNRPLLERACQALTADQLVAASVA